jgi:zinc finger SWIM domain-containing protein 3
MFQNIFFHVGSVVEYFHDHENQLQRLFYQDAEMQRMFSAFPDIIFVDATYKLNAMRMSLNVMMVEDSLGQSEVAAVCLLNSDEKPIIEQFFRCFKENNPAFVNT